MENKDTYALIPYEVLKNNKLTMGARVLYGCLMTLSNQKGYCWAKNEYLATEFEVSKKTVSFWVSELVASGHIEVKFTYKANTKSIEQRIITPKTLIGINEKVTTYTQKSNEGINEKVKDNSIIENYNNNSIKEENTGECVQDVSIVSNTGFQKEKSISIKKAPKKEDVQDAEAYKIPFSEFWEKYQKKEGKIDAEKIWKKISDAEREIIMQGLENYASRPDNEKDNRKYQPYASTFLNQKRYLDENYSEKQILIQKPNAKYNNSDEKWTPEFADTAFEFAFNRKR